MVARTREDDVGLRPRDQCPLRIRSELGTVGMLSDGRDGGRGVVLVERARRASASSHAHQTWLSCCPNRMQPRRPTAYREAARLLKLDVQVHHAIHARDGPRSAPLATRAHRTRAVAAATTRTACNAAAVPGVPGVVQCIRVAPVALRRHSHHRVTLASSRRPRRHNPPFDAALRDLESHVCHACVTRHGATCGGVGGRRCWCQ